MCRLAGIINRNKTEETLKLEALWEGLSISMRHGGPDDEGVHHTGHASLFHCRLALQDCSPAGAQPMTKDGHSIVYNGEVYNFPSLKEELVDQGESFTGNSDTEVVLTALKVWGRSALTRFKGMFALAWWNEETKSLLLARDPFGIKPLYYSQAEDTFIFASELKALREFPEHDAEIDHGVLGEYLSRGYISAPNTIYRHTRKICPGEWVSFNAPTGEISTGKFAGAKGLPESQNEADPLTAFREHLEKSCQRRLIADVPVGVLLSGGVDSSLIAATVAGLTGERVRTYTMGFDDPSFDEAPRAAAIAHHLKTNHTEFYCSAADFICVLPQYADMYDEPFGDASGIATFLLSRGVSQDLKCCLGGDGGDELFGGYSKYRATTVFDQYFSKAPLGLRRLIGKSIRAGRPDRLAKLLAFAGFQLPNGEENIYKLAESIGARSTREFFQRASNYSADSVLVRLGVSNELQLAGAWSDDRLLTSMATEDLRKFMEGDLLVKIDRASMQNGLEVRVPFLDEELVDFALRQPDSLKLSGRKTKILPRMLLANHLPDNLIKGPKKGFTIPLDRWLRTHLSAGLREMARDPEFTRRFRFYPGSVSGIIDDYLGHAEYMNTYPVWFLYVLYLWHQRWPE